MARTALAAKKIGKRGNSANVPSKLDEALAMACHALGHPARVRIVRLLIEEDCIFGSLAERINLAQSTVSQHLSILKRADLVQSEVDGKRTIYCINCDQIDSIKNLIKEL